MQFDFRRFARVVMNVYPGGPYTIEETLKVFWYFFSRYEEFTGEPHPPVKSGQIKRLAKAMPYMGNDIISAVADIKPDEYPEIIDRYFNTPFKNCDYRINHFFSGKIREMRWYEMYY